MPWQRSHDPIGERVAKILVNQEADVGDAVPLLQQETGFTTDI
jgi:hypothetical protein